MKGDKTKIGDHIMQMLEDAARHSEPGPGVTRTFCSKEHKAVAPLIRDWMVEAGMTVELDAVGNVVGTLPGTDPHAGSLIIGSHQDTVVSGGKYDGMLGVALPIACVQQLTNTGTHLPYSIEVVAFGDEEGTRFQSTLIGSRALAGCFEDQVLEAKDADGITMSDALREFGGDPDGIASLARDPNRTLGFLEIHIEQGPILESLDLPVGAVTAITGIERHSVTFVGKAGHAGTVPMDQRRDALCAASEAILAVERHCRETDGLVGVVGKLSIHPNAVNVIPSECAITIELRSPESAIRKAARDQIIGEIMKLCERRGIKIETAKTYEAEGVSCADWMIEGLCDSIKRSGIEPDRLFSGAGHDGLAMTNLCDVGMLFVRCKDGLSHHPEEAITAEDAGTAASVVIDFLQTVIPERIEPQAH